MCNNISFIQNNNRMDIDKFVKNFAAQLDDTDPTTVFAETIFRNIEEWSSLTALSIMAMVDDEYGVQLKGDDIRDSKTVQDLFEKVRSKK